MCGIAGWFSASELEPGAVTQLEQMLSRITHRGPDGSGTCLTNHAAFGHTRLAIIDLEQGQQPMASHDKATVITFNGEIYNYRSLRNELASHGYPFRTSSDTEVIIALYETAGVSGFDRLQGMFAFALWDNKRNTGYLVRDSLGIKPLFYIQQQQQTLGFASEAKALLEMHPDCAALNESALHLVMNFRYIPDESSLFKNILQLRPGTVLEWKPGREPAFSQLNPVTPAHTGSTLDAITRSVEAHFTADVEVGCYLSGGVDSATITALGRQFSQNRLNTFTLPVGDDPNEATYAARSAELLQVNNISQSIDANFDTELKKMIWHLEVPKINSIQISLLAQLAAKHVKVVLSGLGGDELFAGYNVHRLMYLFRKLDRSSPRFLNRLVGRAGAGIMSALGRAPWSESQRGMQIVASLGNWPGVYGLMRNLWDDPSMRQQIYGPRMLDAPLPDAWQLTAERWPDEPEPVAAMLRFEQQHKLVNDLLWQEDRLSMAHGLEVRVPFVDRQLLTHAQQIGIDTLMPKGKLKTHLKQSVSAILPAEILNRPKSGFQVNAPEFFHRNLQQLARQYLSEERINEFGLFNHEFVKRILKQKPRKGLRWHYFILYLMILSHLWVEIFEQRKYTF